MGVEIEAKMRLDDVDALVARLVSAGAKPCADTIEINAYFDRHSGSLRASDRGLRLRVERPAPGAPKPPDPMVTLTYKGPCVSGEVKQRTEIQVGVDDAHAATELLEALGYSARRRFEKHRRRWELGGCFVDIDTLPYLGDFVEIEGPSKQAVLAVRRDLELESTPLIQTSYIALLETHLAQNGITTDSVLLGGPPARPRG